MISNRPIVLSIFMKITIKMFQSWVIWDSQTQKNDWKKDWHGKFDIFWSPQKNVLHIRHSRYINHQSPSGSFPSSNETLSLCWVLLPCWFFCFTTDTPRGRTVNWCAIFRYLQGWHIEAEFRSRSSCQAWKIQGYSSERYHLDPEDVTTS